MPFLISANLKLGAAYIFLSKTSITIYGNAVACIFREFTYYNDFIVQKYRKLGESQPLSLTIVCLEGERILISGQGANSAI